LTLNLNSTGYGGDYGVDIGLVLWV